MISLEIDSARFLPEAWVVENRWKVRSFKCAGIPVPLSVSSSFTRLGSKTVRIAMMRPRPFSTCLKMASRALLIRLYTTFLYHDSQKFATCFEGSQHPIPVQILPEFPAISNQIMDGVIFGQFDDNSCNEPGRHRQLYSGPSHESKIHDDGKTVGSSWRSWCL